MIGLKYEYEVEGFEMCGVRYLPDFYIPSLDRLMLYHKSWHPILKDFDI